MYSWQELRAEILQQELLELEGQPLPKDRSAHAQRVQRIRELRQEIRFLWAKDSKLAMTGFQDSLRKYYNTLDDESEKEVVKAANELCKKVETMGDFLERSSQHLRTHMWRRWPHAPLSQRGKLAAVYSVHILSLGARRMTFKGLRFMLKLLNHSTRK